LLVKKGKKHALHFSALYTTCYIFMQFSEIDSYNFIFHAREKINIPGQRKIITSNMTLTTLKMATPISCTE
jgi:hypothetical protein